ncbi:MAG: hypothetical protein IJT36_04200 [Alphaproteobacteria bacterium]|nr:hypothetical protein [Alphaproteobacteria bacterium]
MATIIAVPKEHIEKILEGKTVFLFWDDLPHELKLYNGISNYIFNDNNNMVYMCYGNKILISANIAAIYNLQFKRKQSVGLKIINARTSCLEAVYTEWKHNNAEEQSIDSEDFYSHLNQIGFYRNYGVKLKNVKPYTGV